MRFLILIVVTLTGIACQTVALASEQYRAIPQPTLGSSGSVTPFDASMLDAMRRMEHGMAVAHSGNPDRDFAAMMIPHHQGAIDMAKAELAFGQDPVLRRLAQAIIVEQQQEIEVMQRRLDSLPPPPAADSASSHHR